MIYTITIFLNMMEFYVEFVKMLWSVSNIKLNSILYFFFF